MMIELLWLRYLNTIGGCHESQGAEGEAEGSDEIKEAYHACIFSLTAKHV
jgi:hypothetical protein